MEYKKLKDLYSQYLQTEEYGTSEETQATNEFYITNMTKTEDIVGEMLYDQIEDLITRRFKHNWRFI